MLNLALVGLLAGSLASATPDGDRDKDKNAQATPVAPAAEATPAPEPEDPRSIIQDTYAFGMASDAAPVKLWVHYAYGEAERLYSLNGNGREEIALAPGAEYDLVSQRIGVGAQINLLNFPSFKFGVGGQLNVAQDKLQPGEGNILGDETIESDFGLQGVKVYGLLKGRVVGIHGGYLFDLGSEAEFSDTGIPTALATSDQRNAYFLGADFDYPSEVFRLFGGVDYYSLEGRTELGSDDPDVPVNFPDGANDGDNIIFFTTGAGVRLSVFEIGAALHIRTQLKTGRLADVGSHVGSVAPYLRISPPNLPASIFVKGSVLEEYTDYGYSMGGANDFVTRLGVTAGITVGFE